MTRLDVPAMPPVFHDPNRKGTAPASKTAWSLQKSSWLPEEFRRVRVNFTLKDFEGHDEVSAEASAFQREMLELAKPFRICT